MRVTGYLCLAIGMFAGAQGYAQFSNRSNLSEFRGRLVDGNYQSYDGLVVEVNNLRDRSIRERVDVTSDGAFAFGSLPEGEYSVRVFTLYGNELTSTVASIGPASSMFELRMPGAKLQRPISGTVSVQQLNHPLSKQVRKLLESGQKLFQDQRFDDAAARFREAAKHDPAAPQVHTDLGMVLSRRGAWDAALEEFRAALTLDTKNSLLHSNLSAALASVQRFDEAESEAAAALKLDPGNARAHYVLAGTLLYRQGHLTEAVSHLVAAQEAIPSARTALQKICAAKHVAGCPVD